MAIKKGKLPIAAVAQQAATNFVSPRPLASNDAVRTQIVQETPAPRVPKRVCTIQKVGGFTFFTTEEDREALNYISFRNKYEKQNVVRAALHKFLSEHYTPGEGLDAVAQQMLANYESKIYRYE